MSMFDVEHQPRAHRILQRALASERMPHAYLFAGPDGVGKQMLAHRLAKLLLCASPRRRPWQMGTGSEPSRLGDGDLGVQRGACPHLPRAPEGFAAANVDAVEACGRCQDCTLVDADTHPDLILIYRQLNREHPDSAVRQRKALQLSVDVIRHFLIDRAGLRPARGRAKVFIVREAERLSETAQNSLLKTLEEPPLDTFIILLSQAMDRMLPTTRSRCQRVPFQSLPTDFVQHRLRSLRPDVAEPEAAYFARHVGGSLGTALRQLDDGLFALKRAWGVRLVQLHTATGDVAPNELAGPFSEDAKSLAKNVVERDPDVSPTDATRTGLQDLLAVLADFYADALRSVCGADAPPINADQPEVVRALADLPAAALLAATRELALADANLARNAHVELALDTLFIRLAAASRASQVVV